MEPYPSFGGGFGSGSLGSGVGSGGNSYPTSSWAIPGSAGSYGVGPSSGPGSTGVGSGPIGLGFGSGSSQQQLGAGVAFGGPGISFSPNGTDQISGGILNSTSKLSPVLESSPGSRLFLISPKRESPDPLLLNTLLMAPPVGSRPSQPLGSNSSAFENVQAQIQQNKPEMQQYAMYGQGFTTYYAAEPTMFRSSISPGAAGGSALLDHQNPAAYIAQVGSQIGHSQQDQLRPTHTPVSPEAIELGGNYSPEEDDEYSDAPRRIQQHALGSSVDSYMQPAIMYRNLFHAVECQLPALMNQNYSTWRIFVDEMVGYAGNAKIFKRTPDKNEQALILTCTITDPQRRELSQCSSCKEYFENRMYFKANPHIKGRIILVKNNNLIKIDAGGVFKINIKYMCCCKHHHVQYYILHLSLTDNISNNLVATATYPIYVKQWRKSTQKKQSCTIILSAAT